MTAAGSMTAHPRTVETMKPRNVETPTVATSGGPELRLGRRAGAPSMATSGRLVALTAPAAAIRCGRFRRSRDNLAKLFRPVHFENPSPVVAERQPLTDRVAPDDGLDAFHRVRRRCGIQAGGLTGGIPANPIVKLSRCFDDHSRIIYGLRGRAQPRPWKPSVSRFPGVHLEPRSWKPAGNP